MGDGPQKRIHDALRVADQFAGTDGAHHKQWVIDQMVRALTGYQPTLSTRHPGYDTEYREWVAEYEHGEDGPGTYQWDEGIAP